MSLLHTYRLVLSRLRIPAGRSQFLHGRFDDVIAYNFLVFPAALLILYHYAHRWLNRFLGWKLPDILYLRNTPSVILAVVLIFWIARNIPVTPFTWLSP